MIRTWFWVSLSYATFGVCVEGRVIVDAAPIARWSVGRDYQDVLAYYSRKGADIVRLGT